MSDNACQCQPCRISALEAELDGLKQKSLREVARLNGALGDARETIAALEAELAEARDEIDAWKIASGLQTDAGDPECVTPADLERDLQRSRLRDYKAAINALGRVRPGLAFMGVPETLDLLASELARAETTPARREEVEDE